MGEANNGSDYFWGAIAVFLNIGLTICYSWLRYTLDSDRQRAVEFIAKIFGDQISSPVLVLATLLVSLLFLAFIIFGGVLWIMMLVHAATKPIRNKTFWIIILVFGGIFAGITYYVRVKRNLNRGVA